MQYKAIRIIISGGGTGGHVFPAIAIADKMRELQPDSEILFVGAEGKMEMEKVPAAGYRIVGLPIVGLQRRLSWRNIVNDLQVPFKIIASIRRARRIIREFRPDMAIGVGGYASAPLLFAATRMGIPSLIQEQNGFAGLTNRLVGKRARAVCVAYEGRERFFPADRIVLSGNPIRKELSAPASEALRQEALRFYGLDPAKKLLLVVGGSLGSGTLNRAMRSWISAGCPGGEEVEVLWQCGRYYKEGVDAFMAEERGRRDLSAIRHSDFIARMDLAYAAADVVISRSGASSVSELCAMGKAVVFVPSPNVAEDHQTHNAMALVRKDAALLVSDAEAEEKLLPTALGLLADAPKRERMQRHIRALALPDAAMTIAREAYRILGEEVPGNVYFIGIGGIGMSALARYFHFKGYAVSGYDRTPSELTHALEAEGIPVHYEDEPARIPKDRRHTLVVYTPAIPADLGELTCARDKGYRVIKRSQMLGEITRGQRCLAVAGTHGKTTTSTLTAHILTAGGEGCSAFLGGISRNYGTNMLIDRQPTVVVEADEFDRSFLQLHPDIAVVTAIDADHLDIYGDLEHVREAFRQFAAQVSGTLIAKLGLPLGAEDTKARLLHYHSSDPAADFHGSNERIDRGCFVYDLHHPGGVIEGIRVGTPGRVNMENSIAAAAIALCYGVAPDKVREAIGSFRGVERRLELRVNTERITYIDDYAHHPEELSTTLRSLREIFPGRKLTAIFQPHLYTRTRDFAPEFAAALSQADKLILLDIYPAREEPIPGVTSEIIFERVTAPEKVLLTKEELMDYLRSEAVDVLVTFGAGNIDRFVEPITELLQQR